MRYHIIINPYAKSKGGKSLLDIIKSVLEKSKVDYEIHMTEKATDATEIAMMLTQNPVEKAIIVVGGDGTINEVINGLENYSNIYLGVIPAGTGNDFVKGMNIPSNPVKALKMILSNKYIREVDIGETQLSEEDSINYEKHRFIVSSGCGYDARICEINNKSKTKSFLNRMRLGKLSYTVHGIAQMINCKYGDCYLELDDGTDIYIKDLIFCSVHNLPNEGGGYLFAPKAKPDDGYLDLCVVSNISRIKALLLLPKSNKGKHIGHEGINSYRCRSVIVKSKMRLPIHTDGETYERQTYIKISLLPERIRLFSKPTN